MRLTSLLMAAMASSCFSAALSLARRSCWLSFSRSLVVLVGVTGEARGKLLRDSPRLPTSAGNIGNPWGCCTKREFRSEEVDSMRGVISSWRSFESGATTLCCGRKGGLPNMIRLLALVSEWVGVGAGVGLDAGEARGSVKR